MSGVHPWPATDEIAAGLWDTVVLGGTLLPGKCEISITGELEIDKGKSGNQHAAALKVKGFKPREVTLTWSIWDRSVEANGAERTAEEWTTMQTVLEGLEPVSGKAPTQPLAVYSPKLAVRGITDVMVEKIAGPDYDQGVMKVVLTCVEFRKVAAAPKGTGKATTTKGSGWYEVGKEPGTGSEWEQVPDANGNVTTTASKSNPSKTETKP